MNIVSPRLGFSWSDVRARTITQSATCESVDQILLPLISQPPSVRVARVFIARSTSVPPSGSVIANANWSWPAASRGSSSACCSGEPWLTIALPPDHTLMPHSQPRPASERDSSSITITWSTRSPPSPPSSSGMPMPFRPALAIRLASSAGYSSRPSSSREKALGSLRSTKSCTVLRNSRCSGVKSKDIPPGGATVALMP